MKKKFTLLSVLLLLITITFSQVTLPHYDGFDYTATSNLGGQGGWVNVNTGDEVIVTAGNLSYSGLQMSSGNSILFGGTGVDPQLTMTSQTTNVVYASFIMRVTDVSLATEAAGGYFFGFGNNSTTFASTVWTLKDGTQFKIGLDKNTSTTNHVFTTNSFDINTDIFVVIAYDFTTHTSYMWVNPGNLGEVTPPTATLTASTGTNRTSLDRIFIRQDSQTETPVTIMDEVRIGTSWVDVTPVASTDQPDWCNLQWPLTGEITEGGDFNVYAQVWEDGVTTPAGQGAGILGWIGYSSSNTNPNTWTNWVAATYNTDAGNNDEYMANIGPAIPAGVYYYASRFQLNGGPYVYGGTGGIWNNDNGTLTVNAPPNTAPVISNIAIDPTNPSSTDAVNVSADVTDAEANLSTVTLSWGLATGVYDQGTITMNVGTAPNYVTSTAIPAQANGTTVYYIITAVDAGALTTVTDEQSYTVFDVPTEFLYFSEYSEGASGNTKYIEIYNGTGADVDLSAYDVRIASNGGAWNTTELYPEGILSDGDVFLIANSGSVQQILDIADTTHSVTFFNGDDALGLFWNGTLVDVIGVQGVDPGSGWDVAGVTTGTLDHTLIRKFPYTNSGTTDWTASAGTTPENSQWIVTDWNNYNYAGWHGYITPEISNIVTTPSYPTQVDDVDVTADVVDLDGTISTVVLSWGLTQGVYDHDITMNVQSGTTYVTATAIPAQVFGQSVYYIITATDDDAQTTVTEEQSYTVGNFVLPMVFATTMYYDQLLVVYESEVTNIDAVNYVLNPLDENITFGTTAFYMGTDSIVVLSNPSASFTEDVVMDTIYDTYNNTYFPLHAGIMPFEFVNTVGSQLMIAEEFATFTGVVTADDEYNQVWIQGSADAMDGVLVYNTTLGDNVNIGDEIVFYAERDEYNGLTELVSPVLYAVIGTATPTAADVPASDLDYYFPSNDPTPEVWEGQLVTVSGLTIDSLNSYYEYFGHDCDGNVICIDDDADYHYGSGFALDFGMAYDITGVVVFANGNYKICPRYSTDAVLVDLVYSELDEPGTQTPGITLDATVVADSLSAAEVFRFGVYENGTDGLPTYISQVTLKAGANNTAIFNSDLAGGYITFSDGTVVHYTGEPTVGTDMIVLPLNAEEMMIEDGGSAEFVVYIWFSEIADDGNILQFEVGGSEHGFGTYDFCLSSQFNPTMAVITGNEFTIDNPNAVKTLESRFELQPNPVSDMLYINGIESANRVQIVNMTGQEVYESNFKGSELRLNVEFLTSGLYMLRLSSDEGHSLTKTFVKE